MKLFRLICSIVLSIVVLILAGCGATVTYETISLATLQPGGAVPPPTGEVVLTIEGKISQKNAGKTLQFDMATLESIGVVQYYVDDPLVKKNILYSGVILSQLLKVAGAAPDATALTIWALDNYSTDMKISDASKWPVLVATRADGAYIPIEKNGSLISVFPFNDFPEIDHLTYDNQWIGALAKITVK